jgi:hypothetical protein
MMICLKQIVIPGDVLEDEEGVQILKNLEPHTVWML